MTRREGSSRRGAKGFMLTVSPFFLLVDPINRADNAISDGWEEGANAAEYGGQGSNLSLRHTGTYPIQANSTVLSEILDLEIGPDFQLTDSSWKWEGG